MYPIRVSIDSLVKSNYSEADMPRMFNEQLAIAHPNLITQLQQYMSSS